MYSLICQRDLILLVISVTLASALSCHSARAQSLADGQTSSACELHVWPTAKYGGVSFHAANFRSYGAGTAFDLVLTPKEGAKEKAQAGFSIEQQIQVIAESARASGNFPEYTIIAHDPHPPERAVRYSNLLEDSIGQGPREAMSKAPCYAELHVSFITVYKTSLSKKLMSGFLVRKFPVDPAMPASHVLLSKLKRGQEQTGLANFSFNSDTLTEQESTALSVSFRKLIDQFMFRKKLWH